MQRRHLLSLLAAVALASSHALAGDDGAIEINMLVAARGEINGDLFTDPAGLPVRITQPGSYRLTGNLTSADPEVVLVQIDANDVTLDLNGFEVAGPAVCSGGACSNTGNGVGIYASGRDTVVRGGTVRSAGSFGVYLNTGRVERVRAVGNALAGILVVNGSISDSAAVGNGNDGILLLRGAVRGCVALDNSSGISGFGSTDVPASSVADSAALANRFHGIRFENGNVVGNLISGNTQTGLLGFTSPPGFFYSGWARNVLAGNGSLTSGTLLQTGPNLCNGVLCP